MSDRIYNHPDISDLYHSLKLFTDIKSITIERVPVFPGGRMEILLEEGRATYAYSLEPLSLILVSYVSNNDSLNIEDLTNKLEMCFKLLYL